MDEAGDTAIDTDTLLLQKARPSLASGTGEDSRGKTIIDHNQLLRERLLLLSDLRRHASLLQSYFEALGSLSQSDAPSGIGTAAGSVVTALGGLNSKIKNAKVGNLAVASFVSGVTKIAVAHFQKKALDEELKKRAETIERELDLQRAALTAVSQQLRDDLTIQLNQKETAEIVLPFNSSGDLPSNWAQNRKDLLKGHVSAASAEAAADAAQKLRMAFVALVEGRFTAADLSALVGDLNQVVSLIGEIRGAPSSS